MKTTIVVGGTRRRKESGNSLLASSDLQQLHWRARGEKETYTGRFAVCDDDSNGRKKKKINLQLVSSQHATQVIVESICGPFHSQSTLHPTHVLSFFTRQVNWNLLLTHVQICTEKECQCWLKKKTMLLWRIYFFSSQFTNVIEMWW